MRMKRPSTTAPPGQGQSSGPARPAIAILCYALIVAAWIVDLLTPQLFVAAILLNGPIALSGLVLSTRLTTALIVFAEIANVVAGYVNGVEANYHWNSIAIGDRILCAASFLLVGYLTIRAQEYARDAGSATERARAAAGEKSLRRAVEAVRSSLNVELVLRATVREALALMDADEAMVIVRTSELHLPEIYSTHRGSREVAVERRALEPALASLIARTTDDAQLTAASGDGPIARMALESHRSPAMLSVRIATGDASAVLLVFAQEFAAGSDRLLRTFAEGASVALSQAWLFMQLGFRNEQIAAQKDALEERNRVIRDIVYALAHDLRTPLTAENVTMQQALDGSYGPLPEQYRNVLRTTLASNADLRRLVDTLLLVARFESGESSQLREHIDIAAEADRITRELRPIAEVKGVRLDVVAEGTPAVLGDPSEVRRAIANLVANAIEATPAGGSVALRAIAEDDRVHITVEDDGYGVPAAQRERLFQRFATNDRALGGGTGLGLYIVRLIAEKLDGTVSFESREPRGSTFTITLPAAIGSSAGA